MISYSQTHCRQCGKVFQPETGAQKLCSPECKQSRQRERNRMCDKLRYERVKIDSEAMAARLKAQRENYHRRRKLHGGQGRIPTVEKQCVHCGKTFMPATHRMEICSDECRKARRKQNLKKCLDRIRADPVLWAARLEKWREKQYPRRLAKAKRKRAELRTLKEKLAKEESKKAARAAARKAKRDE